MADNIVKYILDIDSKKAKKSLKEMTSETKKLGGELDDLGKDGKKAAGGLSAVDKQTLKTSVTMKRLNKAVAAGRQAFLAMPTILKSAADSMFNFTRAGVDAINRLNDLSTASNLSASTIQAVSLAFEASGQSASQADTFVKKFPQRLADIRKEGSDSNRILKEMGIEIGNAKEGYRSSDLVFKDVITTLQNMEDQELRTAAAQRIFKRDVGNLLVALGNTGPIENFVKFTEKFGVDTKKNAAAAAEFQQKLAALSLVFSFARDRIIDVLGGYSAFNSALGQTVQGVVFAAEIIRLFSREFMFITKILQTTTKIAFFPFIKTLKLLGKLAPKVGEDLGRLIVEMGGAKAGQAPFQNINARLEQAKKTAREAKDSIIGFNKSLDDSAKSGGKVAESTKALKELFDEIDKQGKIDAGKAKKAGKTAAQKEAEKLLKDQEKAKEKLADLIKTLQMGDITIEGALKKTGALIRLFEKVKLPTETIEQFQQRLELDLFQKSIAAFEKEMKEIELEFAEVNMDGVLKKIKEGLAIAAIDFGVQITEAIGGSFQAIQGLATMVGGPVTGAIVGAVGSISSIGQQLQQVGATALEDVAKEEIKRRESQKGAPLTEGERKSIENLDFLTAAEQKRIIKEAQMEDARMRVQNFVEGFAVALEVLPAILIQVLPRAIGMGIKGLLQAIFDLPKTLGREIMNAIDRLLNNTGEKIKDGLVAVIDTTFEAATLGYIDTQTYDRRSGGRIPSGRAGMKFTGSQKEGLALLHENEFVVPASGQKPQAVARTMNQTANSGITVNVSGMIVESNAVDQIVREIERRFQNFGTSQSTLFGS